MALCDRCKNKCKFMLNNKTLDTCGLFEKQTNFDRITKTPEALAEFAEHFANCCDDCPVSNKNICEYKCKKCKEALLAWLKQESK